MKSSTVIALGALGAAAWWLSRHQSGVTSGPAGPPPKGPGVPDDEHLYPRYCVQGADGAGTDALMDAQPEPVPYEVEQSNLTGGSAMQGASPSWWQLFHEQCELPAGRIKLSDLWPYHFQLANGMISGQVSRADQAGRLYQKVLDDIAKNKKDAEDLAIANAVISGVAAFIPVVGGAIKLAVGTGLQQGQQGAIQNAQNDAAALSALGQIRAGLGSGSPEGKMWLSNADSNKPPDPAFVYSSSGHLTLYTVGLSSMGGYYVDSVGGAAFPAAAVSYPVTTVNGQTMARYTINPGYKFVPAGMRMRLFAMHQYGWIFPWLSPNAGLDINRDLATRIAGRAAVLRAFDVMSTIGDPIPAPMDAKGNPNRWWYHSPVFGDLYGCTLPPTDEDTYITTNGIFGTIGYHGQDATQGVINRYAGYNIPPPEGFKGTDYAGPLPPPPSAGEIYENPTLPTDAGATGYAVPVVNKGAPVPTQTAQSGYTLPASDAGASTPSPTIAGGGRRLSSII